MDCASGPISGSPDDPKVGNIGARRPRFDVVTDSFEVGGRVDDLSAHAESPPDSMVEPSTIAPAVELKPSIPSVAKAANTFSVPARRSAAINAA